MIERWDFVDYTGVSNPYKRRRLRHLDRIETMVELLRRHNYIVVLGPSHSEKTRLLEDVAAVGVQRQLFTPILINLWQVRTDNEAEFYQSLVRLICKTIQNDHCLELDDQMLDALARARDFQRFLEQCTAQQQNHLVLMIDHLQALPHDLIQQLLGALRAAYMERRPDSRYLLDVVVTGGMALAELSLGVTSPFNIARPISQSPLTSGQTIALARENFGAYGVPPSNHALERIVDWAGGDRYLVPLLVARCHEAIKGYRRPQVTQTVVDQVAERITTHEAANPPFREAIQVIEDDPDTVLDVIDLLQGGALPRNQARQPIVRSGLDRLQLSGAVVLDSGVYRFTNALYHTVLRERFSAAHVGHLLRMNGRWQEAIGYLSLRLAQTPHQRTSLLEAIVQSIYASDDLESAYAILLQGLQRGFGLSHVGIYRAWEGRGKLLLVQSDMAEAVPREIDLSDSGRVEVQTFRNSDYALRGAPDDRRLVARLVPERRPIGLVTVEHYFSEPELHGLPPQLPELLRFLRHAAGAIEDVTLRTAFREIGRAVLSASTIQSNLERVLQIVVDAVGSDLAVLYLLDAADQRLVYQQDAGIAAARLRDTGATLIPLADHAHPAVRSLWDGEQYIADLRLTRVFLPLTAADQRLGVLLLAFESEHGAMLDAEDRKMLVTFADQVAIAVHNMQLLQRTNTALEEKIREEQALRREIERMRSTELAEVAQALVHRLGHAGDIPTHVGATRALVAALSGAPADAAARMEIERHLTHVEKRFQQINNLRPALSHVAQLKEVTLTPLDLRQVVAQALDRLDCSGDVAVHWQPPQAAILVEGDAALLQEAVFSLLENACEAMPEGGFLTVRLQREEAGAVLIYVTDTGPGVPFAHRQRIFEPGFSTRAGVTPHTRRGQGLFVCRAILHRHGGDVTLHEGAADTGATFICRLPVLSVTL